MERLLTRIEQLGGEDSYPVVPLELFFEGNEDTASIGPNLDPHPSVRTFERVLVEIRGRLDVSDVVLQIDEVFAPDEWPFVSAAYVITSASPEDVHRWAAELQPDDHADDEVGPWLGRAAPPGAPDVPEGQRVVTLFWD
jgi:hypothetical protein